MKPINIKLIHTYKLLNMCYINYVHHYTSTCFCETTNIKLIHTYKLLNVLYKLCTITI